MTEPHLVEEFARDVVLLKYVGMNPIIVHGGGPEITKLMGRVGKETEFVGGLRVSDAETVELAKMVLVGKVNKEIVLRLGRHGQPAVGLSGDDGQLFRCKRRAAPVGTDIGFVGAVDRVDTGVVEHVAEDYIPVIASVGADREGNSYNINADEAAGALARALRAYKLLFLTRRRRLARGSLPGREPHPHRRCRPRRARDRVRSGDRRDGAQAPGLRRRDPRGRELRADRRRPGAALQLLELFTNEGIGTKITPAA